MGRGVEDDNKNLSYRSALKSFEVVERSWKGVRYQGNVGKKDTRRMSRKMDAREDRGGIEGSKHGAGDVTVFYVT